MLLYQSTRQRLRDLADWTQVSRGTGTFISMIETLIATVITVSCADIDALVNRAKVYPDLSSEERQEIIDLYYDFGETYDLYCRDAND